MPNRFKKGKCGWFCVLAGLWLIIAPFVLGYSSVRNALWNDLVLGTIVLAIGWYLCLGKGLSEKEDTRRIY